MQECVHVYIEIITLMHTQAHLRNALIRTYHIYKYTNRYVHVYIAHILKYLSHNTYIQQTSTSL